MYICSMWFFLRCFCGYPRFIVALVSSSPVFWCMEMTDSTTKNNTIICRDQHVTTGVAYNKV